MSKSSPQRISALSGHYVPDLSGELSADGSARVVLEHVPELVLYQVAGWADSMEQVGNRIAVAAGAASAPGPGQAIIGKKGALLRVEPMKWWLIGVEAPEIASQQGAVLDLSHSRTRIRVCGPQARECLNRFLPLDLRAQSFPAGSVASSAIHHVGVALWHVDNYYDLFVPRGFSLFIWDGMVEVARQFGLQVV